MLTELTTSDALSSLGEFANKPIIELLKQFIPFLSNSKGMMDSEFKSLLVKLSIAEKKGTPIQIRLAQEVEEWAEVLDDDIKTRLYVIGNSSIAELFNHISSDKERFFFSIIEDLKDDIEDIDGDEVEIFTEGINNYLYLVQNPHLLDEVDQRLPLEILTLTEKEEKDLTPNEKIKIVCAVYNIKEAFVKIMKKMFKEILLVHSQMDYYQRILDYQHEITNKEQPIDTDESNKKILVGIPNVERTSKDKITTLTSTQTTYLFSLLREKGIILKEKNYQSASNISLTIKLQTGYNEQNIRAKLDKYENIDSDDKIVVQKKVQEILSLINSHLK